VPLAVELNAMLVGVLLQMVCPLAEPTGIGLTVTVALTAEPTQKVGDGPVGTIL